MSSQGTQIHYECLMTFVQTGETFTDFNHVTFLRAPLFKTCTFTIARAYITRIAIQQLVNDVADNNFPTVKITIYECDETDNSRVNPIFDAELLCIMCKPEEHGPPHHNKEFINMVFCHPILFYMSQTNVYNVILENITGKEAIENFEEFITEKYGDIFQFKPVGCDDEKIVSKFKHEQILVKIENDLMVPTFLIDGYKPLHTHSWYFFDNFYLGNDKINDVVCHWLCYNDKNKLTQFDVTQYPDTRELVKLVGKTPFSDIYSKLNKKDEIEVYVTQEGIFSQEKKYKSKIKTSKKQDETNLNMLSGRETKLTKIQPAMDKEVEQSTQHINIMVPDDVETAKERYKLSKEYFQKIERFTFHEASVCVPTFPQFGELYNLDTDYRSGFLYSPYIIINTFQRKNEGEVYLFHRARFGCIKYKDEE